MVDSGAGPMLMSRSPSCPTACQSLSNGRWLVLPRHALTDQPPPRIKASQSTQERTHDAVRSVLRPLMNRSPCPRAPEFRTARTSSPENARLNRSSRTGSVLGLLPRFTAPWYSPLPDYRFRRPGEIPVDAPPQRRQRAEYPQWEPAERPALERLPIEAPGGTPHPVEVQRPLHHNSPPFPGHPRWCLGVAPSTAAISDSSPSGGNRNRKQTDGRRY